MEIYFPNKDMSEDEKENDVSGNNTISNENQNPPNINSNDNKEILDNNEIIKNIPPLNIPKTMNKVDIDDDSLDHPKPLLSDYNDERPGDIRKVFERKIIKESIKRKKEGYLDEDLDDDDNKKIYLRVMKRLEKTLGIRVKGAKLTGEPIKNIEIEENIRLITFNDYSIKKDNKIGISVNDKKYVINTDISKGKNCIKGILKNKRIDNQIVKINEGNIIDNIYENNTFNNKENKRPEESKKVIIINKKLSENKDNKKEEKEKSLNKETKRKESFIRSKYINNKKQIIITVNKPIFNDENNSNIKNIRNSYVPTNYEQEIKKFSSSKSKPSFKDRFKKNIFNTTSNHSKNNSQIFKKTFDLVKKNISSEYSKQIMGENLKMPLTHTNSKEKIIFHDINKNSSSNKTGKQYIKKIVFPKSAKLSNISKSLSQVEYKNIIIPDMNSKKDIFVKQKQSEIKTGNIKTETFVKGGKFNNVQTTVIVYSKKDKKQKPKPIKVNWSTKIDNYKDNKKVMTSVIDLYTRTPPRKNYKENIFGKENQDPNTTYTTYKKIKTDEVNKFKNFQIYSPNANARKFSNNKIDFNKFSQNTINKSQHFLPIKKNNNNSKEINNRKNDERNKRIVNFINAINRSTINILDEKKQEISELNSFRRHLNKKNKIM